MERNRRERVAAFLDDRRRAAVGRLHSQVPRCPRGDPALRLCAGPCERASTRGGRVDIRGDRNGGAGGVARGDQEARCREDVQTGPGAAGDDREVRRWRTAPRRPDHSGPGGADCPQAGTGADLLGGPGPCGRWLLAGAERERCDQGGARAAVPALHRRGGRRSVEIRRSTCVAADQAVAQSAGRGVR